ncbi:MAG: glycosyltransferase family 4 protein, partial [Kiritimatiellia bacterium]
AAFGGAQRSLLELAGALQSRSLSLQAAVADGTLQAALLTAGVPVHRLPAVRLHRRLGLGTLKEFARFLGALGALARIVRTVRPEIIHANGLTAALLVVTVRRQIPVLWHVRDLHMRGAIVRYLSRRVARLAGISEAVTERLTELLPFSQRGKIRLVCNGIDVTHFRPGNRAAARRMFQLPPDAPLVGMVAHLAPWKRHEAFVKLAAAIHAARADVRFVIAGRDLFRDHPQQRARIESQIAASGLTGIITWVRELDDLAPLLPALDVLVHPAVDEPFGRVLCEAMAAEIPVIAINRAGPGDIVPDGQAGYLIPPNDPAALVRQTLLLLQNPAHARQMGIAGRQHVLARFDITRTAAETHALYTAILAHDDFGRSKPIFL